MFRWYGMSEAHVTYMARKPISTGYMAKTVCCADSRVLLNLDLCEGEEIDAGK